MSDREDKLTVMKSLRMSEVLLRMISDECKSRKLGFSDYMREAAIAAHETAYLATASCDSMSAAGGKRHKSLGR